MTSPKPLSQFQPNFTGMFLHTLLPAAYLVILFVYLKLYAFMILFCKCCFLILIVIISPLPVQDRGDFRFTLCPSVRPQIWIMRLLKKYLSYTSETSQLDRYQLGDNARHFFS